MALSQRLDIKLSQALVMTPQLQQAIKLLQLNNIELGAFVDEELLQNPLLVRAEERDEPLTALATGDAGDDPRGQDPAFEPGARTELTELVGSGVMPDSEHAPLDADIAGMFESDGSFTAKMPHNLSSSQMTGYTTAYYGKYCVLYIWL